MKQFTPSLLLCIILNTINLSVQAQANTSLSNLVSPTAINQSLLPDATNTADLGSSLRNWRYIYLGSGVYLNGMLAMHASGPLNYFAGANAGNTAVTGNANSASGYYALNKLSTGSLNTANGYAALYYNTTGYQNTATGSYALYNNISGIGNSATGIYALYSNTTGGTNVANGYSSLNRNTAGNSNVAIGNTALYYNTTGNGNTGIGLASLFANTTASNNTAVGTYSLYNNTTGYSNVAVGVAALRSSSTQRNLVAVGDSALYNNGTGGTQWQGSINTAIGSKALYTNTTGSYNTANGFQSLYYNTTGYFNTGNGVSTLSSNTTGSSNTANGYGALYSNTTGNGNTGLGHFVDVTTGNLTNATGIGYMAILNASNKVVIGNNSVTVIGGQVGWSILSDGRFKKNVKENVPGLAFINKLRPVTYNVEIEKYERFIGRKDSLLQVMKNDITTNEKKLRTGLIAQEVEKTAKEIGYDFDGVNAPQNEKDNYSIVYADFVPSLVKAVQELSKQNDELKETVSKQQSAISYQQQINNDLQKQIDELKALMNMQPSAFSHQSSGNQKYQPGIVKPETVSLEQNIPNPFSQTAVIRYTLPQQYSSAKIIITDKSGKTVREINISGSGKGSLQLDASAFASGTYQYSLIANGKFIDSKQMILVK